MPPLTNSPISAASDFLDIRTRDFSCRLRVVHRKGPSGSDLRFLLVHGNPSSVDDYAQTIPALATRGDVIAVDLPGFGMSAPLRGRFPTLDTIGEVLEAVLDVHGWKDAILVGQSHGGLLSHRFAAIHPERTRGVVLLCTAGIPTHPPYRLLRLAVARWVITNAGRQLYGRAVLNPLAGLVASAVAHQSYAPDSVPEGLSNRLYELFSRSPHVLDSIWGVVTDDPCLKVQESAARVRAPLLFIHARSDRLVPVRYAKRLHAASTSAASRRFELVEGGHMVHERQPGRVTPIILDWLTQTFGTLGTQTIVGVQK
jgi:pimeloyl-ACP methyl ester carboxylesterase